MAKVAKYVKLEDKLVERVQKVADDEFSGNWTAALASLADQAIKMRSIDDRSRHVMYEAGKRCKADKHDPRALIDGLYI